MKPSRGKIIYKDDILKAYEISMQKKGVYLMPKPNKPEKTVIDWKKKDGWSKHEQVGRNQAIADFQPWVDYVEQKIQELEDENKRMREALEQIRCMATDDKQIANIATQAIKPKEQANG